MSSSLSSRKDRSWLDVGSDGGGRAAASRDLLPAPPCERISHVSLGLLVLGISDVIHISSTKIKL